MAPGTCSAGLTKYKAHYIDRIKALLAQYSRVPVVAVVEPDSLPNLATNQGDPRCGNIATVRVLMT
jgi:cellulose 1,4-beta-cellobiosidase